MGETLNPVESIKECIDKAVKIGIYMVIVIPIRGNQMGFQILAENFPDDAIPAAIRRIGMEIEKRRRNPGNILIVPPGGEGLNGGF